MTIRTATCCCGQLSLTCEGEPIRISICHCLECQKRSGSVFAVQARYSLNCVTIEGRSTAWERTGESGGTAIFHFCPTCGAKLYWVGGGIADTIAIPVGAFADPSFPPPTVSVYEARQHPWTLALGELPLEHWS